MIGPLVSPFRFLVEKPLQVMEVPIIFWLAIWGAKTWPADAPRPERTARRRNGMLERLLPQLLDNTYRGHKVALWLFAMLVLMKGAMSVNVIFNGRSVAATADGIPLDTYTPAGSDAVVSLFALWGNAHLILCLLGVLALVRYRGMVPLMFALFLLEHLGRKLILQVIPIARVGRPPGSFVNLVLLALMIAGLVLSLWRPRASA